MTGSSRIDPVQISTKKETQGYMNRFRELLAGFLGISLIAASMMPLSADAEALCAVDPQRTVMQESGNETGPVTAEAAVETLMRAAAQREYIEGKAIAIVKGKKGPDTEGEAELISEVSPEAVSSAVNELEAGGAEAAAFAMTAALQSRSCGISLRIRM